MSGPLDAIAVAAVRTVLPLSRALTDGWAMRTMLRDMGWAIDLSALDDAVLDAIPGASEVVAGITEALALAEQLADGEAEAGDIVGATIELVEGLAPQIERFATFDPAGLIDDDASALAAPSFWSELALDLPEYLLLRYLRDYQPVVHGTFRVLGVVVDEERQNPFLDDAPPVDTVRQRLVWDHVTALIGEPDGYLRDHYAWIPGREIDHGSLIADTAGLVSALGLNASRTPVATELGPESADGFYPPGHPAFATAEQLDVPIAQLLDEATGAITVLAVQAVPVPTTRSVSAPVDGIYFTAAAGGTVTGPVTLDDTWTLTTRSGLAAPGATGLVVSPGSAVVREGSEAGLTLMATPTDPWRLLGGTSGPRLMLYGVEIAFDTRVGPPVEVVLAVRSAGEPGMELLIDPGDGDGFVSGLLAAVQLSVPVELGVSWSSATGFTLDAATGLAITVPIDRQVGPVHLEALHLLVIVGTDGFSFTAGVTASAALGPLDVSVANIGLQFALAPPDGAGPLHASLAFKPPDGLGVGIDVGVVSGGGYLDIDVEAGIYEGIVDIDILGVGISAVVIIETDVPGVDGWSMFFALFLELPSIQLGFGFTLTGVGGVAGVNRTLDPEALGSAVRSGSLDAVLFPEDPIGSAPLIIDTFKAIFPAADDRVVFGPIVRIGWGTPTLVEAELGIVLVLPDPVTIAVLGSVTAILPTPDVDLVAINLDIGGVIDFGAQSLTISASLHDSHVVGFALSGDMELRANFGGQPDFLMALGGFHPDFVAPAGFPSLGRLRLALNPNPLLEVIFECYLALTSNSVQFGAALDFAAEIAGFGIAGGASFDAMVQFSPFMLSTSLGFYITVTAVGIDLAGVWLDISVTGPNPWAIDGVARFKVLGFEEQIDVHEIIGSPRDEPVIDPVDTRTALTEALALPEAWAVVASPSGSGVTLAASAPVDGRQLASPDSTLAVSQQIVPLGLDLAHVGEAPIEEYRRFDLEALPGGIPATGTTIDWFAPATFFDLSPVEAISGPSFEALTNGITLGGGDPIAGAPVEGSLEYEQILRDPEMGIERLELDNYEPLEKTNPLLATAHSQISSSRNPYTANIDNPKHVDDVEYALVDALTGTELSHHTTWSAARTATSTTGVTVITPSWELVS